MPTPPLPAATAITFFGPFSTALSLGAGVNAVATSAITVTRFAPSGFNAASIRDCSSRRSVTGYAWVGMSSRTSTSSPEISVLLRIR